MFRQLRSICSTMQSVFADGIGRSFKIMENEMQFQKKKKFFQNSFSALIFKECKVSNKEIKKFALAIGETISDGKEFFKARAFFKTRSAG
jgi:hypothetical protein